MFSRVFACFRVFVVSDKNFLCKKEFCAWKEKKKLLDTDEYKICIWWKWFHLLHIWWYSVAELAASSFNLTSHLRPNPFSSASHHLITEVFLQKAISKSLSNVFYSLVEYYIMRIRIGSFKYDIIVFCFKKTSNCDIFKVDQSESWWWFIQPINIV